MAPKTARKFVSKKSIKKERGQRVYLTLDSRRVEQLQQMIKVFGGDPSSVAADCIARRHLELKKEYPNEFV